MSRLKGIYRRHWYANQILYKKLQKILQLLQTSGIKTILLADTAILAKYYQDYGSRSLYNINLLIHPEDVDKTVNLLSKIGWNTITDFSSTNYLFPIKLRDSSKAKLNLQGYIFLLSG